VRLRHADFANVAPRREGRPGARWLGTSIASLSALQSALVVGSFLRKDHPLFCQRIRQAARKGAKVHSLHALQDDWLMPMAASLTVAPSRWVEALAGIAAAVAAERGVEAPLRAEADDRSRAIAASLLAGERKAVLLGNAAAQHPQASELLRLAAWIAEQTGATVGYLGEAANSVGAQLVGALPGPGGLDAGRMLGAGGEATLKACILHQVEPALDAANGAAAVAACKSAELVVALTVYRSAASEVADVMLPIAPFTETSGTYVSAEGRVQTVHGVVKPHAEARPAWKVLRVLGNLLGLAGFDFESTDAIRAQALGDPAAVAERLDNRPADAADAGARSDSAAGSRAVALERVADVPIYATDPIVRRAASLQLTADANPPVAHLPAGLWQQLGLAKGDAVRVAQGEAQVVLPAVLDATLASAVVRVPAGHPDTAALGPMFGAVAVEKASAADLPTSRPAVLGAGAD
jgi:NADH-quinone oxidoreductase subunit G